MISCPVAWPIELDSILCLHIVRNKSSWYTDSLCCMIIAINRTNLGNATCFVSCSESGGLEILVQFRLWHQNSCVASSPSRGKLTQWFFKNQVNFLLREIKSLNKHNSSQMYVIFIAIYNNSLFFALKMKWLAKIAKTMSFSTACTFQLKARKLQDTRGEKLLPLDFFPKKCSCFEVH